MEGGRGWPHLAGTFATKTSAGHDYVYFQYSDPGGSKRQFAVGRRSREVDAIVAAYREGRARLAAEGEQVARVARLLRAGGLATLSHPVARVIRGLADAGVFRLGGVLVGSHAFGLIGSALAARICTSLRCCWKRSARTARRIWSRRRGHLLPPDRGWSHAWRAGCGGGEALAGSGRRRGDRAPSAGYQPVGSRESHAINGDGSAFGRAGFNPIRAWVRTGTTYNEVPTYIAAAQQIVLESRMR